MFEDHGEKELLRRRLDMIPKRILDLQLEIDKLKLLYTESYERYNELMNLQQKELMKALDKMKKEEGALDG